MQIITAEKISQQMASLMDLLEKNTDSETGQWILQSLALLLPLHAMVIANTSCGIKFQRGDIEFNNLLGHVFDGCDGASDSCRFAASMMLEKLKEFPGFNEEDARNGNVHPSILEKWWYMAIKWGVLWDIPSIEAVQ